MTTPYNIVILTGAGVSAESGINTFRAADGLWENHRVEDVATPEAFARDPALVYRFYDLRRARVQEVAPNAAHIALAQLERVWAENARGTVTLITQNVDDLHDRAGSQNLIHMHGELLSAWCRACDARHCWSGLLGADAQCPDCQTRGRMRPDIVWFGEMPYAMDRIYDAVADADLFVSIGTSGAVYPAAGLVQEARANGTATLELNLEPSQGTPFFDEARHGAATALVPAWVESLIAAR